jgi:hypothetical protein
MSYQYSNEPSRIQWKLFIDAYYHGFDHVMQNLNISIYNLYIINIYINWHIYPQYHLNQSINLSIYAYQSICIFSFTNIMN